jgi:hypothetical protein
MANGWRLFHTQQQNTLTGEMTGEIYDIFSGNQEDAQDIADKSFPLTTPLVMRVWEGEKKEPVLSENELKKIDEFIKKENGEPD